MDEVRKEELAAARREGKIDALLDAHSQEMKALGVEIHELRTVISGLSSDIRTLNEELRIRDERVKVKEVTLADETERRRSELEITADALDRAATTADRGEKRSEFRITRWQGLLIAAATLLFGIVALVLGHPWR